MQNTINIKKPSEGNEVIYRDINKSELEDLVAQQKTEFVTRLCRYDVDEITSLENRYNGLPVSIQRGCSMVGELPAFTCDEDKQTHVQRVKKCIEDSRNEMKATYGVAV